MKRFITYITEDPGESRASFSGRSKMAFEVKSRRRPGFLLQLRVGQPESPGSRQSCP
jgi:hypothetical protein